MKMTAPDGKKSTERRMRWRTVVDSGRFRNGLVYFIILVAAVGLLYSFTSQTKPLEVDISTVAQQAREGKINKIIAVYISE